MSVKCIPLISHFYLVKLGCTGKHLFLILYSILRKYDFVKQLEANHHIVHRNQHTAQNFFVIQCFQILCKSAEQTFVTPFTCFM